MGVLARGGHFVTLSQGERIKPQRNPANILGTEKFAPAQKKYDKTKGTLLSSLRIGIRRPGPAVKHGFCE
jgi:hypothetical protein